MVSSHLKFTKRSIDAVPAPEAGKTVVWDSELRGFGCRVSPKGTKSYFVQKRTETGREVAVTVGRHGALTVDRARKRAQEILGDIARGKDPAAERKAARKALKEVQAAPRMEDLCDRYEMEHLPDKRTAGEDLRKIEQDILPAFKSRKVADVTKEELAKWHRSMSDRPYSANRLLSLLSKMFNLAIEWKMRPDNPVHGIKRYTEDAHERFLSEAEIARLSDVLAKWPNKTVAAALRFLLLTGARRGEVVNATWGQFDFERALWDKPSAHTKTKRRHVVPLSAPAREVLAGLPKGADRDLVFPGCGGLSKHWQRIRKKAGLEDVRLHDLRHSAASILASRGASLQVIGRMLGHTQIATTQRYSHLTDQALQEAADSIGEVVSNAGKETDNIVDHPRKGVLKQSGT